MARMGHGSEGYSTLEVSHIYDNQPQKEVAPSNGDNLPQAVHPDGGYHQAPEHYNPDKTAPSLYYDSDKQCAVGLSDFGVRKGNTRKYGLAPRTFWIVVVAVSLGIVAVIVGGAVGGLLANRKGDNPGAVANGTSSDAGGGSGGGGGGGGPSPGAAANSTAITLLNDSKVAAVNWTDTNRFSHYAVFSQDSTNSIMVSLWDSQNQTWSAVNISNILLLSGSPVKAKAGTPLSAVSTGPPTWPFQMDLYFLTPSNNIMEVCSTDMDASRWHIGNLGKTPKTADENSPLASIWHRCLQGCSGNIYVTYLSNNKVEFLNGSDWTQSQSLLDVDSGSPLVLFPFTGFDLNNPSSYGQDPELRLYVVYQGLNGTTLGEVKYTADKQWIGGQQALATNLPSNPPPQIAGAPFNYWFSAQLTILRGDGTLEGTWWDNSTPAWKGVESLGVKGGDRAGGGFTAIAQHHERRLYAVVDGTVQEYRWEQGDPMTMISVGKVTLATDLLKP